jgi:hypothetical protein
MAPITTTDTQIKNSSLDWSFLFAAVAFCSLVVVAEQLFQHPQRETNCYKRSTNCGNISDE